MKPSWCAALLVALASAGPLAAAWPPPVPEALILTVRETAGVARTVPADVEFRQGLEVLLRGLDPTA